MTQLVKDIAKCGVCGKGNQVLIIKSTSQFGAQDLDTRPPAMFPFTIFLQRCEHCGFVSPKIESGDPDMREFVNSEIYKTCDGIKPISETAKHYIQYALLQAYMQVSSIWTDRKIEPSKDKMFWGYLNAAWACDDAVERKLKDGEPNYDRHKCIEDAEKCRRKCLDLINTLIVTHKDHKDKETLLGIKADLLRRTGQFDAVIVEFEGKVFEDPCVKQVIEFELDRARECDAKRYNMDHINQTKPEIK